jgi:ankyrin repeat protein
MDRQITYAELMRFQEKERLVYALAFGYVDIVRYISDLRLSISRRAWNDSFCIAAQKGHLEIVQFLYESKSAEERSLIEQGSSYAPEFILDWGACQRKGLILASEYGHLRIVQLRLQPNSDAFNKAIWKGHIEIVRLFLRHFNPQVLNVNQGLISVANTNHIEIAELLLDHGADPLYSDSYSLRTSAGAGHVQMAKLLLDHGSDISAQSNDAYRMAKMNKKTEMMKFLLRTGISSSSMFNFLFPNKKLRHG